MATWMTLFGLGAFHGLNPGMGWLFAVALGLQEHRRLAVWRSLLPLGLGHALAVGAIVLVAVAAGAVLPLRMLRMTVGVMLVALGLYRLIRHRHPRYGGMRVGMIGLTIWSFLMATAHGAGVMVLPVVLSGTHSIGQACELHSSHSMIAPANAMLATAVHGAGYLIVTALAAWVVFEKLGVTLLRQAWINVDLVWAAALIITGTTQLAFS